MEVRNERMTVRKMISYRGGGNQEIGSRENDASNEIRGFPAKGA